MENKKELSELSKRFLDVISKKGYSHYKISKEVEIFTEAKLSHIKKGRNQPSDDLLNALLDKFPDINRVWLLTGEGDPNYKTMIQPNKPPQNQDEAPYLENMSASAGLNLLTHNGDATSYIKIPGAGVDVYINVFGDSMYPKYCSGEIIGIKRIDKDMVFFGLAYVIEMNDGEAYIKYIFPGKDDDHWSLCSENPKFPSKEFHLDKISKVYKIKTTVSKNSL